MGDARLSGNHQLLLVAFHLRFYDFWCLGLLKSFETEKSSTVSFHSKCKVLGQRSDTVQQFREPGQRSVPRFFRGPHREGRAPPYAEKVRFRRAGIKKAHAVILCCLQNQTVHRRTA